MQNGPGGTIPYLLRDARDAYTLAIRRALTNFGLEELPRHTAFVLSSLRADVPFESIVRQRRGSLERAGTIDALLAAGCLRKEDGQTVLTPKGEDAAAACEAARLEVDEVLRRAVGRRGLASMQRGLAALIEWKESHGHHD